MISIIASLIIAATPAPQKFLSLCYHDVQDDAASIAADPYAVTTGNLVAHFEWLRANGYVPVSFEDILLARDGKKRLPEKAVLLTFDDGYKSTYTRVFPLLRAFRYPALVAVVTSWVDLKPGAFVQNGRRKLDSKDFVTWKELREMRESGLVELASHTHALHVGVLANPQHNMEPAAATRAYHTASARYETRAEQQTRIAHDLEASTKLITARTGARPRAVVWPYGAATGWGAEVAKRLGMDVAVTLHEGRASTDRLDDLNRLLIVENSHLRDLVSMLSGVEVPAPKRFLRMSLDEIDGADAKAQEKNLDRLIDRVHSLRVTDVILEVYATPKRGQAISHVYFPNDYLPMRADLANRTVWQLRSRTDVNVFAALPTNVLEIPSEVREIFADLASLVAISGVAIEDSLSRDAPPLSLPPLVERIRIFRPDADVLYMPAKTARYEIDATSLARAKQVVRTNSDIFVVRTNTDSDLTKLTWAAARSGFPTTVFMIEGVGDPTALIGRLETAGARHIGFDASASQVPANLGRLSASDYNYPRNSN